MRSNTAFSTIAILLGVSFSPQALGVIPTVEATIQFGNETVSNIADVDQTVSIDGITLDSALTTPWDVRGQFEYKFGASSKSGDSPGIGRIVGTAVTIRNNGPDPVGLAVEFDAMPGATGSDAFANIQLQQTCVTLCRSVAYSLRILPDEFQAAYNSFRQLSGDLPFTLPAYDAFLATDDTLYGASYAWTGGKIDLGSSGLRLSFLLILESLGQWQASVNASTTAIASTATADGRLSVAVSAVPEPDAYAMLLLGLGLVAWVRRRKTPGPGQQ